MIEKLKGFQDKGFGSNNVYFIESDGYYAEVDYVELDDLFGSGESIIRLSV
jgi:hypothetical protein